MTKHNQYPHHSIGASNSDRRVFQGALQRESPQPCSSLLTAGQMLWLARHR